MDSSARSSFGVFEVLRIAVPGLYFASLLYFFLGVFFPNVADWADDSMGPGLFIVFGTLVAGITIYAKETPKRRRAFTENQPSTYLLNRSRLLSEIQPLNDADAQRLYFYILNNHIPPTFHEKIFFFGTVYTIMINVRRTSFWFGLAFIAALALLAARGEALLDRPEAFVFGAVAWAVYFLNVRYNKADRKMQENYQDQIFWLQMHDDLVVDLLKKRNAPDKG
jgi:hypothetical protein